MRALFTLAALALALSGADAQTYSHEPNTYRHGGTYAVVGANSAESCARQCDRDQICLAWSFQRATRDLGNARCELKQTTGRAQTNPLMISGISPRLSAQGQATQIRRPSGLLGAPTRPANNIIRQNVAPAPLSTPAGRTVITPRPAPAPRPAPTPAPAPTFTPAPIQAAPVQTPPQPVAPPTPPATTQDRINVPVTQEPLPPGAILRETPPPTISFAPLTDQPPVPATDQQTLVNQIRQAPPATRPVTPLRTQRPNRKPETQTYPIYSVNRDVAQTPDELAEEQTYSETIIENLELDGEDLAADIGQPVIRDRNGRPRPGGGS